jgi:hypothetical protein
MTFCLGTGRWRIAAAAAVTKQRQQQRNNSNNAQQPQVPPLRYGMTTKKTNKYNNKLQLQLQLQQQQQQRIATTTAGSSVALRNDKQENKQQLRNKQQTTNK